jgi:hypothetical protein
VEINREKREREEGRAKCCFKEQSKREQSPAAVEKWRGEGFFLLEKVHF